MPAATRQRVLAFTSPDLRDLLFWETDTLSRADYTDLSNDPKRGYGTAHPNSAKFPNHKLCYWEADPDFQTGADGQDSLRVRKYYVADRADQERYNFEFTAADIGGQKFNAVRRTFITPRDQWDDSLPAMGAVMSTEPAGKFPAATYVLSQRSQKRIGQRELDALYVVEEFVYVEKVTISKQTLDDATGGVLTSSTTLYYRGELYGGAPIETSAGDKTNWGLTAAGVNKEVEQISDNWWAVTRQDVVPQGGVPGTYGSVLRTYETWEDFSWPAVVSAGSLNFTGITRKSGSTSTTVRVIPEREFYKGPTKFRITQYWSLFAVTLTSPVIFDVRSRSYSGAQYSVSISNVLVNGDIDLVDNIGTSDPVFDGPNVYGAYPWAESSNLTDWPPDLSTVAVKQQPFRGGFLITETKVYQPV